MAIIVVAAKAAPDRQYGTVIAADNIILLAEALCQADIYRGRERAPYCLRWR